MTRPIRVLHLEDQDRDARLIRDKLALEGLACEIALARGREDFVSGLRTGRLDLILLDYNVPGYDGMEALRHAREALPDVPVIVISGVLDEEHAVECLKAGAVDYLLKQRLQRLGSAMSRALQEAAAGALLRRQEQALRENERRLELALEASNLATWDWDIASGKVQFSPQWWRILGYEPGEIPTRIEAWETLTHPDDLVRVRSALADQFKGVVSTLDVEYRMRAKHGEWRWIRSVGRVVERDSASRAVRGTGTHGDVSERKQAEERIARLNRIYAVLSGINSAIVRVADRRALFRETCRIATEQGRFRFAWVGMLDDKTLDIVPVAWAGFEDGFLAQCPRSARPEAPGGRSVAGEVMRSGKASFVDDVDSNESLIYREQMRARGYRARCMLPLTVAGRTVGLLSLYAGEPGVFDDEERKLLQELAGDVSFALDHLGKKERLDYLAYYDELTGLPNRTLFRDRADQILMRLHGQQAAGVAVVILDVDGLHNINASAGRQAGDGILREIARRLGTGRLGANHVARVGADVFAALLVDLQSEAELLNFLEQRVGSTLGEPIRALDTDFSISVRCGVAVFPGDGADAEALLQNAEAALRSAKARGDRCLFYSAELNARAGERLALRSQLAQALERGQLELHYQPQLAIATGEAIGMEALLRWRHPDKGWIPPSEFIPIAEESGLILPIGEWGLRTACAQNKAWQDAGLPPLTMSVNLSALQFRQADIVQRIDAILRDTGLSPRDLDLEITESMVVSAGALARLRELTALGVTLSMDDFGTGYSSLGALRQYPLNRLKMDRSFVHDLPGSEHAAAIASAIVGMARALGLSVIAEGVETATQAEFLQSIWCEHAQGFYYSKALPPREAEAWLRSRMERRKPGDSQ